jgi:hypothetical protein
MTIINLNYKHPRNNINNDDINKFLFINGIMGKITEINENNIYIIPYAKAYYKKIIIDDINETAKIYYKFKDDPMNTLKINIYHKLYFVINEFTFNNIIECINYKGEPDILNEIIETDDEANISIFKTYLMTEITKYIKNKDEQTTEQTNQTKNEFKKKFQIYEPDELKKYLLEIIIKWGFNNEHYKILNNAINEIYKTEQPTPPTPPTPKNRPHLYSENYILY